MNEVTEYRVEYFNNASRRWERLPSIPRSKESYEEAVAIMEDAKNRAQGVKFRIAMRTCTPWCECVNGGQK